MRQRRTSLRRLALPASGGLRLYLQFIQPLSSLTGFQKPLPVSCTRVVREHLCVEQGEISQYLGSFCQFQMVFFEAAGQIVRYAHISLACFSL